MANKGNANTGKAFELEAMEYFKKSGITLQQGFKLPLGVEGRDKKDHAFDLGSNDEKIIVECKCHTWTAADNSPSAKMTIWNEAMYYFLLAPDSFKKILFVLKDFSQKRQETLAAYYIRSYKHLIPQGVEIIEYDWEEEKGKKLVLS